MTYKEGSGGEQKRNLKEEKRESYVTTTAIMTPANNSEEPMRSTKPNFSLKIHQAMRALKIMTTELMGEQIDRGA